MARRASHLVNVVKDALLGKDSALQAELRVELAIGNSLQVINEDRAVSAVEKMKKGNRIVFPEWT